MWTLLYTGTSKKDLIKQSQSFARYLKSRNPPVEKNILNSKVSAIKQEVEESCKLYFYINEFYYGFIKMIE